MQQWGRTDRLRHIVGGSAGNLIEWYDWYVYSAFTLYFAPAFFPQGNATAQLLSAAAVFAVGFVMRPIGAWLMGVYADRKGRKAGLTLSVSLMCAGSLLIAATPGYASIGTLAPALLVLARLMQGLSVGGEYGASATYLSEMAGKDRRGFYSSFQYVTLIAGQLAALAVLIVLQAYLSETELERWGWRIPFAIGGVLAVAVFWLRRRLAETESFHNARAAGEAQSSGWALFRHYPRQALLVMALTAGGTLAFYASINAVVKAELFPAHIRALGVALPYALANTLFGGTAEYLALWFKTQGMESGFYWYVSAMIGVSLVVYVRMRDTRRHSLIMED